MKILFIIIGAMFAFALLTIIYVAVRMIFIAPITEAQVRAQKAYAILAKGVQVEELERQAPPLEYEYSPTSGNVPSAVDALLSADGRIAEGQRVYDQDPNKEVYWLKAYGRMPDKIIAKDGIHSLNGDHLASRLGSFEAPILGVVRYVGGVNEELFLVEGDPVGSKYVDSRLWLVNHKTFFQHQITDAPYHTFQRPPKVLKPADFNGEVLVYYVGSVDYGFGGDASRPKYSVVRVFSEAFPQGIDIVKFAFKAGTIVSAEFDNNALILTGDPSRPGPAPDKRRSPRFWRVTVPAPMIHTSPPNPLHQNTPY